MFAIVRLRFVKYLLLEIIICKVRILIDGLLDELAGCWDYLFIESIRVQCELHGKFKTIYRELNISNALTNLIILFEV